MAAQMTIELNGLRFFGPHGLHPEEAITGNEFEVDVALTFPAPAQPITSINETVNYAAVYQMVAEELKNPRHLLETIAMTICASIKEVFPAISSATVSIKKLTPPIANFTGTVGVRYTHTYES